MPGRRPAGGRRPTGPTGKLTICAAKTNAAIVPISTVVRSPSLPLELAHRDRQPGRPDRAVVAITFGSSTVSGMCIALSGSVRSRRSSNNPEFVPLNPNGPTARKTTS